MNTPKLDPYNYLAEIHSQELQAARLKADTLEQEIKRLTIELRRLKKLMKVSEIQAEIHDNAKAKGWYDGVQRTPLEFHMLIVSEVAEATEAVRMRKKDEPVFYQLSPDRAGYISPGDADWRHDLKPEGELSELADVVIRVMDYCAFKNWNLEKAIELKHKFNQQRPYRHGGKTI